MLSLPKEIDKSLADFIKSNSIVDGKILEQARASINGSNEGLISHLLSKNLVTEDAISDSFASFYGLKKINVTNDMFENRPLKDKVNDNFIKKNRVIPFRSTDNSVTVIVADPAALNNVNSLKMLTGGRSVETLVTNISMLENYLHTLGSGGKHAMDKEPAAELDEGNGQAAQKASQKKNPHAPAAPIRKSDLKNFTAGDSGSDIINFVDFVIEKCIKMGASDIHFEIFRKNARLRTRKDGMLQELDEFTEFLYKNYSAIITRLKIMANLNISERRLPQDGGIAYNMDDKIVDLRMSVLPTANGERVVLRVLDPESANFSLDQLGLPEEILKKIRKAIHAPQGMILVTGPTGSGKSTTLYAVLKELNDDRVNIMTAEDPVEFDLRGVGQVQVKESIGLGFPEALRSFLRQDPEIIMVGEIRDKETGDIAIKAALTGHLLLSTLHTNSAPATITRMVNMGIPPYLITASLSLVIAQRLARVNCESCRKTDESCNEEVLKNIGFSEADIKSIKPQKGAGCDKCNGRGIKGRRGIYEVLAITDVLREAILEGKSDVAIRDIAKKEGFIGMQEIGRGLIKDGIISVEEYQRILILE